MKEPSCFHLSPFRRHNNHSIFSSPKQCFGGVDRWRKAEW